MENEIIAKIKHEVHVIQELAIHSKSMSIGAKEVIRHKTEKILKELELVELELLMRK